MSAADLTKSFEGCRLTAWRHWCIFRWTWPRNDPRRYGAIPDGRTDCSAAFEKATAWVVRSNSVTLGAGTYAIGRTIDVSVSLRGASAESHCEPRNDT